MALSKLVLKFFFSSSLLLILSSVALAENSNVFTEYIGARYNGVQFTDVPINSDVNFNFILAFAIDYTGANAPTNGKFQIWWQNTVLTPEAVASIKASNPNAKVGLSLGGATVQGSPVYFSAESVDSWVANAVSSLTHIIEEYHLDGIDINYENFKSDDLDDIVIFMDCIGNLITTLKSNNVISFASIAPFASASVQKHYSELYTKYYVFIDYVNFQFYAYSSATTVEQFLEYYNEQLSNYAGGKLLASFTTDTYGGGLKPPTFFDACKTLQSENKLHGIFVWSADNSKESSNYLSEYEAQQLLANYNEANHLKLLSNA